MLALDFVHPASSLLSLGGDRCRDGSIGESLPFLGDEHGDEHP